MASDQTLLTTEQIIPTDSIRKYPNLTEIPYPAVDAVVEQPFASYPGACYGHYWFDMEHIKYFRSLGDEFRKTGNKEPLEKYYEEYIFGCETFDDYLDKIGYKTLKQLRKMDEGQPIIT